MATRRISTRRTGRAATPRDHHTPNRRHTGPVLTALVLIAACAPGDPHGSGASDEPGWPGEEWPVSTPEAEGVDPAAIDALVADIDAGRYGLIDHLLLIRHGRVIADHHWDHGETYAELLAAQEDTVDHQFNYDHPSWHPLYRDTHLHSLQSVTKSVLSVAFGIAVDAGHIPGVGAPAWPYFEAHGADLSDPRRAGTGTRFDYNDGVSVLLGKIVREATGQRLDLWARQHLFEPVGIDDFYWKVTPGGEIDSEGGLYLSTHDLARVGYLMLRGGVWNGRQVVSREWVQASTSPVVPDVNPDNDRADTGYGYQWWVPLHEDGQATVFAANGYGGQFLHVIPEYDLITVFNGWTLHESPELSSWVAWRDRILPAVSAEAQGPS